MAEIIISDALSALRKLPEGSIDCCVTSPPYYALRDYGVEGQLGLEDTPEEFIDKLADIFSEVRRIMKPEGTLWLNMGDSYAGSRKGAANYPDNAVNYKQGTNRGLLGKATCVKKFPGYKPKDLIGIPWMLAFELRKRGWYLRQDIIWEKTKCMPESVTDRCTKAHEYLFLLSKSSRYYFDGKAIRETAVGMNKTGLRNKRSVWHVATAQSKQTHSATFPEKLISPCIIAGCPEGGVVLDPFFGTGTTGLVAKKLGRDFIGIEINPDYAAMATRRIDDESPFLF